MFANSYLGPKLKLQTKTMANPLFPLWVYIMVELTVKFGLFNSSQNEK